MREIQKSSRYNNYIKAIKLIKLKRKVSTSFLQRNIKIGFGEACSIMNDLERRAFIRIAETKFEVDASLFDVDEAFLAHTRNYPQFKLPRGYNSNKDFLIDSVQRNLQKFYPNTEAEISERINDEIDFLSKTGFDNIFLIVWDLLETMLKDGLSARCFRGSVTGSIIAYILGITEFDPIKYGLVFDKFSAAQNLNIPTFHISEEPYLVEDYLYKKYPNVFHNGGGIIAIGNCPLPDFQAKDFRTQAEESGAMIIGASANEFEDIARELSEMIDATKDPSDSDVFKFFENPDKNFFGIPYFQYKSAKEYAKKLKPNSLLELAAIIAYNRPGCCDLLDELIANKINPDGVRKIHPIISEITKETYGVLVFQEQWIGAAHKLTACDCLTLGKWRNALKKKECDSALNEEILGAIIDNLRLEREAAEEILKYLEKSITTAFSKSHALGCAKIAFEIAKLRVALLSA